MAVRMAMFSSILPENPMNPIAPVYRPRAVGSTSSMISMARIFGAPVMEPPGKVARRQSIGPIPPSRGPAPPGQPARARSLDRTGGDAAALHKQKPFRGVRQNLKRSTVQVSPKGRGKAGPEAAVQRPGVALEAGREALRDIGLIDVAGGDVLQHRLQHLEIAFHRHVALEGGLIVRRFGRRRVTGEAGTPGQGEAVLELLGS